MENEGAVDKPWGISRIAMGQYGIDHVPGPVGRRGAMGWSSEDPRFIIDMIILRNEVDAHYETIDGYRDILPHPVKKMDNIIQQVRDLHIYFLKHASEGLGYTGK